MLILHLGGALILKVRAPHERENPMTHIDHIWYDNMHAKTPADLAPREREIMNLIASGQSNQEIASELYLSVNSIKTYIRSAYRKIGISRRTHAVLWWCAVQGEVDATMVHRSIGATEPNGQVEDVPANPARRARSRLKVSS